MRLPISSSGRVESLEPCSLGSTRTSLDRPASRMCGWAAWSTCSAARRTNPTPRTSIRVGSSSARRSPNESLGLGNRRLAGEQANEQEDQHNKSHLYPPSDGFPPCHRL